MQDNKGKQFIVVLADSAKNVFAELRKMAALEKAGYGILARYQPCGYYQERN